MAGPKGKTRGCTERTQKKRPQWGQTGGVKNNILDLDSLSRLCIPPTLYSISMNNTFPFMQLSYLCIHAYATIL
jgi:hypothetical protein